MKQTIKRVKDAWRLHDAMIVVVTGLILGPVVVLEWALATDQESWKEIVFLVVLGGLVLALLIMFALAVIQVFAGSIYEAVTKAKCERAANRGDESAMDKLPPGEWGPGTWRRTRAIEATWPDTAANRERIRRRRETDEFFRDKF